MRFEKIPKKNAKEKFGYITCEENFYRFIDEFNIVGVRMSQPETISASYFLRLLQMVRQKGHVVMVEGIIGRMMSIQIN